MTTTTLSLIVYLTLKHYVGDFVLQSRWMVANKGRYGHAGGIAHALVHGGLTMLLAFFLPLVAFSAIVLAALFESLVHYHIDWGKQFALARLKLTPADTGFWRLHGIDQLLHMLCYIVMTAVIAGSV